MYLTKKLLYLKNDLKHKLNYGGSISRCFYCMLQIAHKLF